MDTHFERYLRESKSRLREHWQQFPEERLRFQEGAEEVWAEVVVEGEVKNRRVVQQHRDILADARKHQPTTPEEWWAWIAFDVDRVLWERPPFAHLVPSPESGRPRLVLHASDLIPRVYLALALEVAGAGHLASCSYCSQFYTPVRAPKRRQRNYCPACRKASVPQRLHMRETRQTCPPPLDRVSGAAEMDNVNEARVEYRLARDWILEALYGDRGAGGLDVLWIQRF